MAMQNFNELREYIISHITDITGLPFVAIEETTSTEYPAIYLVEKPECHKPKDKRYIVIRFNQINGGVVKQYAVEVRIYDSEIYNLINIKDNLTTMIDFHDRPCEIAQYKKCVFSNEGGIYFDDVKNLYCDKLFFEVKKLN